VSTLRIRTPLAIDASPTATLRVRWIVSRAAVRAAAPAPIRDSVAETGGDVELLWRIACADGAVHEAEASLLDTGETVWHALAGAGGRLAEADGLLHVDIDGPGPALRATWRRTPNGVDLLYTATSALAALGLPGGRYEIA
jgi:hypothetical protein